jgi:hypothetical protein
MFKHTEEAITGILCMPHDQEYKVYSCKIFFSFSHIANLRTVLFLFSCAIVEYDIQFPARVTISQNIHVS